MVRLALALVSPGGNLPRRTHSHDRLHTGRIPTGKPTSDMEGPSRKEVSQAALRPSSQAASSVPTAALIATEAYNCFKQDCLYTQVADILKRQSDMSSFYLFPHVQEGTIQ